MNKFVSYIARRYLVSKKSRNVINIITGISMGGICVGTMALVVIMSAFNGLEELVAGLYSSFDPDIKVTTEYGKTFSTDSISLQDIENMPEVAHFSKVLEETVVLKHNDEQTFATLKGVEESFLAMSGLDSMMYEGEMKLKQDNINYMVAGYGIADKIALYLEQPVEPVYVYAAKRNTRANPNLASAFRVEGVMPAGIFAINPDFDNKYALVPFDFAAQVLGYENRVSALEIDLEPGADGRAFGEKLQNMLGPAFEVRTRYQLNEIVYKTNQTEKWFTFLILSFILVVATFNLVGSLTMLIIDKREDIFILKSMGADKQTISRIFLMEGMLISVIGGGTGLLVGLVLTVLQNTVGIVSLSGVIVEYYPMKLEVFDFVAVSGMVLVIGFLASWFPSRYVTGRYYNKLAREM